MRRSLAHRQDVTCGSSQSSSSEDDTGLDDAERQAKKEAKQKRRKARNQRRYYRRHIEEQQAKGRERTSRNRALVKLLWQPTTDDDHALDEQNTPNPDATTFNETDNHNATTLRPTFVPVHSCIFTDLQTSASTSASSNSGGSAMATFRPAYMSGYSSSDSDAAADDFSLRSAAGRLIYVRRKLFLLEKRWGTVDGWPISFGQKWLSMRSSSAQEVALWFDSIRHQAQTGRHIIGYLARVMDGEMPTIGEWKDLWLEAYQLLGMVYSGVLGLEHRLDLAERWYGVRHADHLHFDGQLIV